MEPAKSAADHTDRSAAGGALEAGDPAVPADRAVVSAADERAADPTTNDSGAKQSPDKSVAKSSADQKHPTLSETREQRLREVAADFDRRRDEAQYQAALNRWRQDDATGCREALGQLLARTPSHCKALLLLADVEMSEGSPKAALEEARQVLALEPKNAEAHHVMGLALDALGETAAAIAHYEQATRLDSQNEQYAACYHAALDASILPSKDSAAAVRDNNTTSADSSEPSGDVDAAASIDRSEPAGAASDVVLASATAPVGAGCDESPEARRAVGRAADALRNNRPQQAVEIAAAALSRHPKSSVLYRVLGASQYGLGNYGAAQVAIAQALSLDKSDALAYFLMGSTLSKLGQSEAAERQFAEATRLDPRFGRSRD